MCPGADKIARPDMVALCWTQANARSIMEPKSPSWLLFLWNLQPFATPDTFDSILAYLPAGPLQQRCDPAVAITAILAGKSNDSLSQSIFVFTLCRPVALRASGRYASGPKISPCWYGTSCSNAADA